MQRTEVDEVLYSVANDIAASSQMDISVVVSDMPQWRSALGYWIRTKRALVSLVQSPDYWYVFETY